MALALSACAGTPTQQDGGRATASPRADDDGASPGGGSATEGPGDGGGEGGGASIDACPLLTTEEVSAAFGVDVAEAERANLGGGDTGCNYNDANGELVATTTYAPGGAIVWESLEDEADDQIEGIGDGALWVYNTVTVRKGDAMFQIFFAGDAGLDEDAVRAASEDLARIAVERMP